MSTIRDISFIASFGTRVRTLRMERGFAKEHFANMCDMELSQLNRIELGKVNTSISHAKRIADALEINMAELFEF